MWCSIAVKACLSRPGRHAVGLYPEAQLRAAEIIRQLGGSGLILTPRRRTFTILRSRLIWRNILQGKSQARERVQLFKLAWDLLGEQFGSRQLQYEWFYAGDPIFTRSRFYRSPAVAGYKDLVTRALHTAAFPSSGKR